MVSTHTVSYGKWCILIDDNLQNFKVRRKHSNCQVLRWLWSPLSGPQRIKRVGGRVGRNPRQGGRLLAQEVENHWNFWHFWTQKLFFQVSAELHRRWCNVGNWWVFYHTNIIRKKKLFGGIYTKNHCILHRSVEDTMLSQQTYVAQVFWRQTQ